MIDKLLKKIESGRALVGVVGLGYVGLPLVREFTRGGAKVLGFDVDTSKVRSLIVDNAKLVIDIRNTTKDVKRDRKKIVKAQPKNEVAGSPGGTSRWS